VNLQIIATGCDAPIIKYGDQIKERHHGVATRSKGSIDALVIEGAEVIRSSIISPLTIGVNIVGWIKQASGFQIVTTCLGF